MNSHVVYEKMNNDEEEEESMSRCIKLITFPFALLDLRIFIKDGIKDRDSAEWRHDYRL